MIVYLIITNDDEYYITPKTKDIWEDVKATSDFAYYLIKINVNLQRYKRISFEELKALL